MAKIFNTELGESIGVADTVLLTDPKGYEFATSSLLMHSPELPEREWDPKKYFDQRHKHRGSLFKFAMWMSISALVLLIGIVMAQFFLRLYIEQDFEVISERSLEILAVAVFGQVFGVIYIIAKALWSNDEFGLMSK